MSTSSVETLNDKTSMHSKSNKKIKWILLSVVACVLTATVIAIAVAVPMAQQPQIQTEQEKPYKAASLSPEPTKRATSSSSAASAPVTYSRSLMTPDHQASMSPPSYAYPVSPYANLTRLKVLEVSPNSRVFIMGDVHGCLKEMNALLSQVQFEAAKDVLILTGDLVARGEDPVGVIRRAQEIGAYCVRGNHDDKAIRTKLYLDQHGLEAMSDANELIPEGSVADPLKFGNRHLDVAKALGPQEFDYLMGCPLILDIPNLNARVVHGGLDPAIPNLVDNDPWSVMNMRSIMQENNQPSKKKMKELKNTDAKHWAEVYRASPLAHNNATVYYGHDASLGVQVHGKTVGLDSGCVYGRKLTTMEVHSQKLFQVDCEARKKDEED